MTFEMHQTKTSMGEIKYFKAGQGRPILYLHSECSLFISKPLKDLSKEFLIYIPILPGLEGSKKISGVDSLGRISDLWAIFIDEVIKEEKVDIIGYSLGGNIAAIMMHKYSEKIDQITLIAPKGFMQGEDLFVGNEYSEYIEKIRKNKSNKEKSIKFFDENAVELIKSYKFESVDSETLNNISSLDNLTLVLLGTEDEIVSAEVGHLLRERLKKAHFIYIYDAANGVEVDQPERVSKLLRDFFQRGEAFIVNWGGRSDDDAPKRDEA